MSIPGINSYNCPPEFELKSCTLSGDSETFCLNEKKLPSNKCHMFYPVMPSEELVIVTGVEYIAFNPSNKELNARFNIRQINLHGVEFFHCSFPKEARGLCESIAKIYNMVNTQKSRTMFGSGEKRGTSVLVQFPQADNILNFKGPRVNNPDTLFRMCDDMEWLGKSLDKVVLE